MGGGQRDTGQVRGTGGGQVGGTRDSSVPLNQVCRY